MPTKTASPDSTRIHEGCRVKKVMGAWHPCYDEPIHKNKYIHGTVVLSVGFRKWVVWWDDGYNYNRQYTADVYDSHGLVIEKGDIEGPFSSVEPIATNESSVPEPSTTNDEPETVEGTTARSSNNGTTKGTVVDKQQGIKKTVKPKVLTPVNAVATIMKRNPHPMFIHHLTNIVTPQAKCTRTRTAVATTGFSSDVHTSPSETSTATAKLFSDGTDMDNSDSSISRNTYIPSPDTVYKASNANRPNDEDANDTTYQQNIISHCYENSELLMWKGKVRAMENQVVTVTYGDKHKYKLDWKIESRIRNQNIHDEDTNIMPIVEYKVMEPETVNPLKNFFEVFPEVEMKKCVQNFNVGVKNDQKLVL